MKSRRLFISTVLTATGLAFASASALADSPVEKRKTYREFENAKGNTVQVRKRGQTDHQGNARGARNVRVTDADGNLVRKSHDRVRKTDDGKVARAKKRTHVDTNGNVRQKRTRVRKDGNGNFQGQRQARKFNSDGRATHRAKGNIRKNSRGVTRRSVRQRRG